MKVFTPTARLATRDLYEEALDLKQQDGKPIVGGTGLIAESTDLGLIEKYQ